MKLKTQNKRTTIYKWIAILLFCLTVLPSCGLPEKMYSETFVSAFDTVTKITGRAESEESFNSKALPIREELERYHRLFDIYNEYDGINNLKTLNDKAALSPIKVDKEILELLDECKKYYSATGGLFNPAMGSVLSLWHKARSESLGDPENAYVPSKAELEEAALHTDPESIVIDRESSTVYFADPDLKLDVGGIAKGWAVQRVCENAPDGLLISVGGNIYATGAKDQSGTPWRIGIQNPDGGNDHLEILNITEGSVVTSGSYHRAYTYDGKLYHHIIDPNTLYPSELWTSVTVVSSDSSLADVLSTALFMLDIEEGQALLDIFDAKAMWLDQDKNKYYSTGFETLIK